MCYLKILVIWLDKRPPSVENVCFGGRKEREVEKESSGGCWGGVCECLTLICVWNRWMQSSFAELIAVLIPLALKLKFGGTIMF